LGKRILRPQRIMGSPHLSRAGFKTTSKRALIQRRRLQILIHSYLYYREGTSIIPDSLFDTWCKELKFIQDRNPQLCEFVDYDEDFRNFDGVSGYNLNYMRPEIVSKAKQLLHYKKT